MWNSLPNAVCNPNITEAVFQVLVNNISVWYKHTDALYKFTMTLTLTLTSEN